MNHGQIAYSADLFTHELYNQLRLWKAIDAYVRACGGEPGQSVDETGCPSSERVTHINSLIVEIARDAVYGFASALDCGNINDCNKPVKE